MNGIWGWCLVSESEACTISEHVFISSIQSQVLERELLYLLGTGIHGYMLKSTKFEH